MIEEENETNDEIKEIKNSIPIIDFIWTPVCDLFEMNGKMIYISY